MTSLPTHASTQSITEAPSNALRGWLIVATIAAVVLAILAVVSGLLVNMDTKIEMNPNGDILVRRDAIEHRTVAWAAVGLFDLLLAGLVWGWWRAFTLRRKRSAIGLSLIAVVPACALLGALVAATVSQL